MTKHTRIYFTGFMGSGKSTLAPPVANVLGFDSLDLDVEIEHRVGYSVSEIFEQHGELYFRRLEQELLQEFSTRQNIVVALGGGTVAFENNLEQIKSNGLLVYLEVEPDILLKRIRRKQHRPLLKDSSGAQLPETAMREKIISLLQIREHYYNQADITITMDDSSIALTVDKVVRLLRKHVQE
ncbi:MAG: shikimate kinase [Ignavibacteriae bacterium]|nr:shikimate kinase [Ignavibacteriota bacterium]